MKFAKELEADAVSEWRAKYLDYRTGKKKLHAVERALRAINDTSPRLRVRSPKISSPFANLAIGRDLLSKSTTPPPQPPGLRTPSTEPLRNAAPLGRRKSPETGQSSDERDTNSAHRQGAASAMTIPGRLHRNAENTVPRTDQETNYGSFIPTPPEYDFAGPLADLTLPGPALSPNEIHHRRKSPQTMHGTTSRKQASTEGHRSGSAYEVGKTQLPSKTAQKPSSQAAVLEHRMSHSQPEDSPYRPFIRRMFTQGNTISKRRGSLAASHRDVPMEAYRDVDHRQAEFFKWMEQELDKIESFYKEKEEEANERLQQLRDQLHEMRNRRLQEVMEAQHHARRSRIENDLDGLLSRHRRRSEDSVESVPRPRSRQWFRPIEHAIGSTGGKVIPGTASRFGKNTKALEQMGSPPGPQAHNPENHHTDTHRDFVRREKPSEEVPYRQAKRKLKMALAEYYRGLELLKSYALLNRTAFRKINKKYDKTVRARSAGKFMSEKVNPAWFVQSATLDGHLRTVEDLYSRYFERGNHKIAVGKLRKKGPRAGEHYDSVYRNGLLLGAALVFGVQGTVYGENFLHDPDPAVQLRTAYLLQIYAGYFLVLFLFLLFTLACRVWINAKINYAFIFEFDTRDSLDWRQLAEIPCFLLFLQGVIMWLNFQHFVPSAMFIYWPVILIGLSVVLLFLPARYLYHRSRSWFLYANWRLLLAGVYPVEFRDFFMGDMYCSLTYAMGNLELFFCLYATHWNSPGQCKSNHSRLLGFFTTLPGIWRALQCLRRFYDTRNVFPHLVNGGKYTFNILFYMSLSLYRIEGSTGLRAFFIFCATANAIYSSIWDLAMDWSLLNPYSTPYPFLRETLGYKKIWPYYLAMMLDPILRFNWIFYAIFAQDLQHSAGLSFFISLTEVMRRAMWVLFRVENEHCTNVGRFRASRDVPLPYDLPTPPHSQSSSAADESCTQSPTNATSSNPPRLPTPPHLRHTSHDKYPNPDLDVESQPLSPSLDQHDRPSTDLTPYPSHTSASAPTSSSIRHRRPRTSTTISASGEGSNIVSRGFARLGSAITSAHAQDFERRLPAEALGRKHESDDDDEDDEEEKEEEEKEAAEAETVRRERQKQGEAETAHGGGDQQRGDGSEEVNGQHEQEGEGEGSDDFDDQEDTRDLRHAEELLEDAGESNHPPS